MSDTTALGGKDAIIHNRTVTALLVVVIAAAGIYAFSSAVSAQSSDSSEINVTVSETIEVTVEPTWFNFSNIDVQSTNFSDHNDLYLDIENTGSTNLSSIYAHVDTLSAEYRNPLGTGRADRYAAGRFVWIKNQTSRFYHVGSLTWNITESAGGWPSGVENEPSNTRSMGYYRNATGDYLWALAPDGGSGSYNYCNTSSDGQYSAPILRIKDEADNGNNRDLDSALSDTTEYTLSTNNTNWAQAQVSGGPLDGHYVASGANCTKVHINRFDNDGQFPITGNNDQYLVNPNTELAPGEEYSARVGAAIPSGIPAGVTNQSTLTITASKP